MGIFFYPFFVVCFSLVPPGCLCSSAKPGSTHPGSPGGRVGVVWEMVRARPGAVRGRSAACSQLTSGRRGADPRSRGSSVRLWEPGRSVSEGRVSEPQFNKPSAAPAPIPRKLVNAVRCPGSALLRQTGSGASLPLRRSPAALHSLAQPPVHSDLLEASPAFRGLAQA